MAESKKVHPVHAPTEADPFNRLSDKELARVKKGHAHVFGHGHRCKTDTVGFPRPENRSPFELVVDASEGFIPLWEKETILRWRFQEQSLIHFSSPSAAKTAIRTLLGNALLAWGDAVPVKFAERNDAWDFEIVVRESEDCDINGCVLASAFFPDAGRHELVIYPTMFSESTKEQVDTLAHELGHVFGLRHFFAKVSEKKWPSVRFGRHKPFSIMNYGAKSVMTAADQSDLKLLYDKVWSGDLEQINGTPIKLVYPFHAA